MQDEFVELSTIAESIESVDRVPGLMRSWDIERLLDERSVLIAEPAGNLDDGTQVFQVYKCALRTEQQHTAKERN